MAEIGKRGAHQATPGLSEPAGPTSSPTPGKSSLMTQEAIAEQIAELGEGAPVQPAIRQAVEATVGSSLGEARVHTSPAANALARAQGARGFAFGSAIVLAAGESASDTELIAHELTHVAQQRGSLPRLQLKGGAPTPSEHHADAVAAKVTATKDPEVAARASHDLALALPLITSRWKLIGGDLFAPTSELLRVPPVARFEAEAYALITESQADVQPVLTALGGPGRAAYRQAIEGVLGDILADAPHVAEVTGALHNLAAGGQVQFNATRIMAHQALLSGTGKRALATHTPVIAPFERYLASACRAQGELEAKDQLMHIAQAGVWIPDPVAVHRAGEARVQACTSVLGIVHSGAAHTGPATEAVLDKTALVIDPKLVAKANHLTAVIDQILDGHKAGAPLNLARLARIRQAVDTAGPDVRDLVWADKVTVAKLIRAIDAGQASSLIDQLDPVERLYQMCKAAIGGDEDPVQVAAMAMAMGLPMSEQARAEQRRHVSLKAGGGVYTALHDWLAARSADRDARTRVLTHTKLKSDCIGRLPGDEQGVIYRMIARGSDAPSAEDTVLDAADKHQPAEVIRGLRALAGSEPGRLAELEHNAVFRTAIESMTGEVTVDGQQVRPYQLALVLWGHTSGAVVDPTAPRQGEVNVAGADDSPLTIEERIALNRELFDPALVEIHDEIIGKNLEVTSAQRELLELTHKLGNPQKVMDLLVKYDRLAATTYKPLLRRDKLVFGAELEARYTQKYQHGLRTWIYEHAGPNNRSGSNRVLGTEQGAGVGMFNGKILAAGEVAQPGKLSLSQALRENVVGGAPLSEIFSVQARELARAIDDADVGRVLQSWRIVNGAVQSCRTELQNETGIAIRAIDLIRNAYQEQGGHLETRLAEKFAPPELAQIRGALGLVAGLDEIPGAKPPSISERAERLFADPAKLLWGTIGSLSPASASADYVAVRAILDLARAFPTLTDVANQQAEPRVLAIAAGHDAEERPARSFAGYYRLHYGATPERHLSAVVRSFGDADRPVKADMAAALVFGSAASTNHDVFTKAETPDAEKVEIGPHNRQLVRATFTEAKAVSNAEAMWRILHTDGKLQLIETELYGPYNDEEQRLIRVAFRKLSGGLDLTFFVRQAIEARARIQGQKQTTLGKVATMLNPLADYAIDEASKSQGFTVGAAGATGDSRAIATMGSESELDRGLAVAMTGELDVRTLVRNAVVRKEEGQVVRIVDDLTPAERKQVLADGPLVDAMQTLLSQQDYERVFKVLTGQADLTDRMLSRTIGDTWWKKHISGSADSKGMEEDLTRYIDNLTLQFDRELRGKLAAEGQAPDAIDNAIKVRTREACADIMTDANVKDIIDRHLGNTDAAKARSVLLNGGVEHDYLLAAGASAAEVLGEIRSLPADERQAKLADPNYLRRLGQRLTDEKDYRDAINALTAGGDKVGSGGGGLAHLDDKSRSEKQTWDASTDARETLRALASLSPAEYARLRGDPQLQLQTLNALKTEEEKQLARELLFPSEGAAKQGASDAQAAARDFVVRQCVYRLRVACKTSNKWSVVLEEAIAVYKAALDDAPADLAAAKPGRPATKQASAGRTAVWSDVAADVAAFAKDHDANPGAVTTDLIAGSHMIEIIRLAVMREADPSDALISAKIWTSEEQLAANQQHGISAQDPLARAMASEDKYKEEDLIAALNNASDEHVAQDWTSIAATPAGGGTTMKQMYARYRTAFVAATPGLMRREAPPSAPPQRIATPTASDPHGTAEAEPAVHEVRPLGDTDPLIADADLKRQQFLQFVVQVSTSLEAMLRKHMGDNREATADADPDQAKLSGTGNKRYDNLTEVVLARVPRLAPAAIAQVIEMEPADQWLLTDGVRQQVGMFNLRHEKNLRSRGEQTSERSIASGEKEDLDTSRVRYGRAFAVALTDGKLDRAEVGALDHLGDENDRAREAYKTALETAAMWASLIVGTLVTIAATILTGGLALGPVAAMAIGGATAALSAAAKSLVNKSILDNEWDRQDTHELIAKEVITSLVTIGTTYYAQKLLAAVGAVGTVAKQANAARGVLGQQPPLWRVFLNQASEQVTSTAMSSVVEAGLEATDPMHWIDGYREGEKEAKAAGMARLAQVPGDIKNGVITSLLTAGIGHVIGRNGGHVQFGEAAAQRRSVSLSRNIKKAFGDPEQKVTGALVEWAMNQKDPIDWSAAPAELLQGTIRQYGQIGTEMHTATANTASRGRAAHDSLAISRHEMTSAEQAGYTAMQAHVGPTDGFVSAKDYAAMRHQVAATGLSGWEAHHPEHALTAAQREAFVHWVREAADGDALAERATSDPRTVEAVVNAGKAHAQDQRAQPAQPAQPIRPVAAHERATIQLPAQHDPAQHDPTAQPAAHERVTAQQPAHERVTMRPPVADKPSRGPSVAARVVGATYEGEGRFRITTAQGDVDVRVARTVGTKPRMRRHPDGDGMLLEIPLGLGDAELDHAIIDELSALHDAHAPPHDRITREHAVPVAERPTRPAMEAVVPDGPDAPAHARRTQHAIDAVEPDAPAHARRTQHASDGTKPDASARPRAPHEADAGHTQDHAATSARKVHEDLPAIQHLTSLPPEVMIGAQQQAQVEPALQRMSHDDYIKFQAIEASLGDPVARGFLYKAVASNNSVAEIEWLADQMVGRDAAWLVDNLTLGDPRGVGGGIKQQWAMSCNASMTITMKGNYDPIFALRTRQRNVGVGAADEQDPMAMNMHQADLEQQMLESEYMGTGWSSMFPAKHVGVATPRASQTGTGRPADDLLNGISATTGLTFHSRAVSSPHEALPIIDAALGNGMQVPILIGGSGMLHMHYVLAMRRRPTPNGFEYQFHDTAFGETRWVTAHEIATNTMPLSWNQLTALEVPTAISHIPPAPPVAVQAPQQPPAHARPTQHAMQAVDPNTPASARPTQHAMQAVDPNAPAHARPTQHMEVPSAAPASPAASEGDATVASEANRGSARNAAPGMAHRDRRDREARGRDRERQRRRDHDGDDHEEVDHAARPPGPRTVPYGMKDHQFQQFAGDLYAGFAAAGYGDIIATVQGSGATNQSHETGRAFDEARVSDYDVAIQSPQLVARAVELGISLNGALDDVALKRLGLAALRAQLSAAREREVNFLVVDPERSVNILDRAGIPVPRT